MLLPHGIFRALACAILLVSSAFAQPYTKAHKVSIPQGKTAVVRVTSVASILRHFTAAEFEMKPGDLIFALDGEVVDSVGRFNELFEHKTSEVYIRIDFLRDGAVYQAIGPLFRFDRGIFKSEKPRWGGDLETATVDFTPAMLEKPVHRLINGIAVATVKDTAAAGVAGLHKGDRLLSINGLPLGRVSRSDILTPLFPEGTPLTFVYLRDGQVASGSAPLTRVKTGFTKLLIFGFAGDSHMFEVPSTDLPEQVTYMVSPA